MNKINIGVQLYTLREVMKTDEEIEKGFKLISDTGYKSIQISAIPVNDFNWMKETADKYGLEICCTHTPFEKIINQTKLVATEHDLLNCNIVGIGYKPEIFPQTIEGYYSFAKALDKIGAELKEYGKKLAYHNHHFEFQKFSNKTGMDILLENTSPENVGFIFDTYWGQAAGVDPEDFIHKIRGRMDVCHLKDMNMDGFNAIFTEIGCGNMNFAKILAACIKTNVKYAVVEQDNCYGKDPYESLEISYRNISKILNTK